MQKSIRKETVSLDSLTALANADSLTALANAIIVQAAKDYRRALRKQKKDPGNVSAKIPIEEAEQFFRSEWYRLLTTVDGETLIKQLKEEVTDDDD